ncbi:MAG: sigma-70 family RNA polymerase sigma factor [Bacteroidales bacterium]|nr:sigma-70 family RNA polymerase sigma factor [Bacteroidales bacterium]
MGVSETNNNLSEKAKRDLNLVNRALSGDQQAYSKLMSRYRDAIYYMLLKMVNNSTDAEDLTIETFGKAFKNLQQYVPDFAFSTWLFKIATNNCIDFIRKQRTPLISIDQDHNDKNGIPLTIQESAPDPEENMIKSQKAVLMRSVVDQLKPRYKDLIVLRYFKEYSYEEIANELNLPLGTVKAQLFRAKELLYNILKKNSDTKP